MRGLLTALSVAALVGPASTMAQTVQAGHATVELTGRVQIQYNTTDVPGQVASTFEARRIRAALEVELDGWITGKIEPDFAGGGISLKDAWMNLAFDPVFELKVGHFKKPFSRLELTSSTQILPVERGVRLRGLSDVVAGLPGEEYELLDSNGYLGRDLGATAHGRLGVFGYSVGVFNGNGPERDTDDAKSVAARVTVAPVAGPLSVGVGVSRQTASHDVAGDVSGVAYEVDVEWGAFRRPGLHVQAEAMTGENLAGPLGVTRMQGAQVVGAWYFPLTSPRLEGLEVVARASWGDPDTAVSGDQAVFLTPGVTVYLHGRKRLQVNYDVYVPDGGPASTYSGLLAQLQLYF